MSNNQNNVNKGNQKGGAPDQKRKRNESEQSRNDKKHNQPGQRHPRVELGTSKLPPSDPPDNS